VRTCVSGRSRHADIVLGHESVTPRHAELVVCDEGRGFLTDCGGPGGTFRRLTANGAGPRKGAAANGANGSAWMPIRQDFVDPDEPLRFGEMDCTLRDLLRQLAEGDAGDGRGPGYGAGREERTDDLPSGGRLERDPETGEIVRVAP